MPEELAGPSIFSYNLQVETPIDIDELIYTLAPEDLPLIHGVNTDGMPILQTAPASDVIFYWLEENVPLPRTTLAAAIVNGTDTTTTLASGGAVKFSVGDAIRIENEVLLITAINTTTEVITFTRGSAAETNTTAAAHPLGAEVIGLGSLLIEGAVGAANFQGRDKYSNYCQIWTKKVSMSRTEQAIRKYGVPSELARQMANAMHHAAVGIEQAALYGVKHQQLTNFRRQTGGLKYYLASNVDSSTTWLTVESIEDALQRSYDLGGRFEYVMARPAAFGALDNTTGSERIQTVVIDDARRGRKRAQVIMTEFGEVQLVRNRWCKVSDAFGLKRANFTKRNFAPMQTIHLAKTDDTDSYMMVTEAGFEVKGEAHMAGWTALDPSSAMPADLA